MFIGLYDYNVYYFSKALQAKDNEEKKSDILLLEDKKPKEEFQFSAEETQMVRFFCLRLITFSSILKAC
jgi:hypothetical protein